MRIRLSHPSRRLAGMMQAGVASNGNLWGVAWMRTWPHVSLGVSAHVGRHWHPSLHLPVGVVIVGCVGAEGS